MLLEKSTFKRLNYKKTYLVPLLKELNLDIESVLQPSNPRARTFNSKYKGLEEEIFYEVTKRWKELQKNIHPDKIGGDGEESSKLNEIYSRIEYLLFKKEFIIPNMPIKEYQEPKKHKIQHMDGRIAEFSNIFEFSRENNLDNSTLSKLIHNKRGTKIHKGWKRFHE